MYYSAVKKQTKQNYTKQNSQLYDMDGHNFLSGYECELCCYIKRKAKNKPINDICNIKLGKKYFF